MARAAPDLQGFRRPPAPAGFSLVELIVVIVIAGVVAAVVGIFIAGPIQGFFDQARRAGLVDAAQLALTRMGRDLRAALPNSIRINAAGDAVELLLTLDGDRYRTEVPGDADDRLDITLTAGDGKFNTFAPLGRPNPLVTPVAPYDVNGYLAIYPLQQTGANPYVAANRTMTAAGTLRISPIENPAGLVPPRFEYQVSLTEPGGPGVHQFPFESPTRRVFLVSGPVTWRCAGGALIRYHGYTVSDAQPDPPIGPPLFTTTVARNVETCAFRYAAGTAQRNAVVFAAVVLAEAGERVRLLRQVHVDNTP